jgi:hypothetical protein
VRIRQSHINALKPYLLGEEPRENGEQDMFCPLHEDHNRSASLNVQTGDWYCFASCGGGRIIDLIRKRSDWVKPPDAATRSNGGSHRRNGARSSEPEVVTEGMIDAWCASLQSDIHSSLEWVIENRGIHQRILEQYRVGWDPTRGVYAIPVYDSSGTLVALRRYNPRPAEGRRKMWGATGLNGANLYPLDQLENDAIVVVGGEWDALATIQQGIPAITRTAAEMVWKGSWTPLFEGKTVYLCHDMDDTGQAANRKVERAVGRVAAATRIIRLPFKVVRKSGKDISDYWAKHSAEDFRSLLADNEPQPEPEASAANVLDAFDSGRMGAPVRLNLTIKGKREPGYTVPRHAELNCTQDAGAKCEWCPLNNRHGSDKFEIVSGNSVVLEMVDSSSLQVEEAIRKAYGAQKCNRLEITYGGHQAVEILYARPSMDYHDESLGDYKTLKLTNVGKHDTPSNTTVSVEGALYPNPRTQVNEFQSWQLDKVTTSIDEFSATSKELGYLTRFQPDAGQTPIEKMRHIAQQMARNVTKIYGRPEMHMMMDAVWHSPLEFNFRDEVVTRGWIDGLVLGDTRTGKSEAAARLARHYQAGELVNCEAASLAGIVGGLQQFGSGREWAVTWGAIPINDRRMVILDEVSGLPPEAISQMSDIRSSGVAKITKIQTDVTFARTRLLWLSNPRQASMGNFTWGVQAIRPLIGNNEDIARFDLVCAVAVNDVSPEEINRAHSAGRMVYHPDACAVLVRWAWTRRREHISWGTGAEQAIYDAALALGRRYVEDPPLLQAANARVKVARIAIAIAMRLYSSPDGEIVVVRKEHVAAAVQLIDLLYGMQTLGYAARSKELISDSLEATKKIGEAKKYIKTRKGLPKFLRSNSSFKRQDLEEVLNISREEANACINKLWELRQIRKEAGIIVVEPVLHTLLREGTE